MKLNRILNMVRAKLRRYFWMPCPICGEMFGGHEVGGYLMKNRCEGTAVCSNCEEKAIELNKKIPAILIPRQQGFDIKIDSCKIIMDEK